ncbi:putrescine aminotransferase [Thermosporothrix hazakensis]|jgi:putrescine aminotransferase|uniref:Putrescine aminotransferase n=2 Tax=Thermosporothrix TaxID=768650 RepID=A0A326UA40_THEHA|nr:putrescine aminotransferase [Thermosporothrix hazakensis]PZW32951.1 putrescine aminotransferase [Thermosporothrix hazakensis]BBH90933.1 putrescine aminotransferase [Thermosporothrix sp. COM3]GCE48983.1 putrescine aminotransferase [Thermosporothrix hazakensis]
MRGDGLPQALHDSQRYLDVVLKPQLSPTEAQWLIEKTVDNFTNYFNSGFIDYRKSVTEAGDYAAVEWTGRGATFKDALGRTFIDCLGGYGLFNLGWAHPEVVRAVQTQAAKSPLPSQELLDPLRGMLAHLLAEITPGDIQYSFFVSSGTEAVEGAMKLAKLYTGKSGFIAAVRGFHGKTTGSLALTGKALYRRPPLPLHPDIYHVPYGDAEAVEMQLRIAREVGNDIAAVVMEPIQGEAGAIVPPDDFWPRLRQICDAYQVLLIADEVQTGMGRTGKMWGVEHWNVVPDIMTSAKALGGGVMPVGAFMAKPEIWQVLNENPFIHTTTTGGNPLACAAAIAAIHVSLRERVAEQAATKGEYLLAQLRKLATQYSDFFEDITGKGLLLGMHFKDDEIGYAISAGLFKRGVLISGTMNNARVIRVEPPLVITRDEIDTVLDRLDDTLRSLRVARAGERNTDALVAVKDVAVAG